jgi:hypothetical protein
MLVVLDSFPIIYNPIGQVAGIACTGIGFIADNYIKGEEAKEIFEKVPKLLKSCLNDCQRLKNANPRRELLALLDDFIEDLKG